MVSMRDPSPSLYPLSSARLLTCSIGSVCHPGNSGALRLLCLRTIRNQSCIVIGDLQGSLSLLSDSEDSLSGGPVCCDRGDDASLGRGMRRHSLVRRAVLWL